MIEQFVVYRYPWGDKWDSARANTVEGHVLKPTPVGAYASAGGVGQFDAEDQSGNVYDWTSTIYAPYSKDISDRESPEAAGERIIRGGSWLGNGWNARCASRYWVVPIYFTDKVGFRVVSPGS